MSTKAKSTTRAKSKFITLANGKRRRRPVFSAAGRAAISKAQTLRWRKYRAAAKAKAKAKAAAKAKRNKKS